MNPRQPEDNDSQQPGRDATLIPSPPRPVNQGYRRRRRSTGRSSPTKKTPRSPTAAPMLPLPEAARLLGIPRASAYRYAQAGTLPVKRFGRRVYVITAKVRDLFEPESPERSAA